MCRGRGRIPRPRAPLNQGTLRSAGPAVTSPTASGTRWAFSSALLRPSSSECVFRRTYFHKNNICFGGTQHLDIIYSLKILKCQRNLKECSQHRRPKPAAMSSPTAPAHEAALSGLSTTCWGEAQLRPPPSVAAQRASQGLRPAQRAWTGAPASFSMPWRTAGLPASAPKPQTTGPCPACHLSFVGSAEG